MAHIGAIARPLTQLGLWLVLLVAATPVLFARGNDGIERKAWDGMGQSPIASRKGPSVSESANGDTAPLTARYTPIANFAYQLDCVSGVLGHCVGRNDYTKLWLDSLGIDASSSPEVSRWRAIRQEHRRMAMPGYSAVQPGWSYAALDPDSRVLAAGFGAKDLGDYKSRLALLMHDALSAEAAQIVDRLYGPFRRWWHAD